MVRIELRDDKQFIHGIEELEGCRCYSWGENLLHVSDYGYGEYLVNSHNAHPRIIQYAGINRWNDCKDGLIALSWMLYPDGRYFADEDGYGMEDNDEVKVYCVLDDNLQVVRPFGPVDDVTELLNKMRREKKEVK